MALILNLETATRVCSVCLAKDGQVIAVAEGTENNEHAAKLTLFIDEVMSKSQLPYTALDAVAISSGPGSYTGLRIGAATAKGLCYALNKPLISVPTLMALAEKIKSNLPDRQSVYMPVLDAGNANIYMALYDNAGREISPAAMVTVNQGLVENLSKYPNLVIGGNSLPKLREANLPGHFRIAENISCDSRAMAAISEKKFIEKGFEDVAYFQPFYLSEFRPKRKTEQL